MAQSRTNADLGSGEGMVVVVAVNFKERVAQQLRTIILLHLALVTFRCSL